MTNVLVLGGSGVVGKALINAFPADQDISIWSIGIDPVPSDVQNLNQVVVDRNSPKFFAVLAELDLKVRRWDMVVDLCAFNGAHCRVIKEILHPRTEHFITLSTTLVYDRTHPSQGSIGESSSLARPGMYGGYVDGKISLEQYWQSQSDCNWTILRPYHILGSGHYLGCVPLHNRDPRLLSTIQAGEPLTLINAGDHSLSWIHAEDIARAILGVANFSGSYGRAYNVVHQKPVTALEYYTEIAMQLGCSLRVEGTTIEHVWRNRLGWEMTTLPHVYSSELLYQDTGISASMPFSTAIENCITHHPAREVNPSATAVHNRMNKLPAPNPPGYLVERTRAP